MKIIILFFSSLVFQYSWAHGVHDSGNIKPQRGGILRSLETVHIELVQIGKENRIYIFNKDKKPRPLETSKYKVSAKVILPRKKGVKPIKLVSKKHYWASKYDAKGLHRYSLEFSIEQGGHKDKILFTIEPKK